MIEIHLYQHTADDDVDLGIGYVDALPPVGALLALRGFWRVVTVYVHPAEQGSMTHQRVERHGGQVGMYYLFVEPAEGPFH